MNTGQLAQILRAAYLVDVESHCKLEGKPLFAAELERAIEERL
jgi:2-oxoglutarate/2-oxoacid ferredoxin oxidoreductase subunit alpha